METKQRIGNEVTDRAGVQVTFSSHFFIFPFPVLHNTNFTKLKKKNDRKLDNSMD